MRVVHPTAGSADSARPQNIKKRSLEEAEEGPSGAGTAAVDGRPPSDGRSVAALAGVGAEQGDGLELSSHARKVARVEGPGGEGGELSLSLPPPRLSLVEGHGGGVGELSPPPLRPPLSLSLLSVSQEDSFHSFVSLSASRSSSTSDPTSSLKPMPTHAFKRVEATGEVVRRKSVQGGTSAALSRGLGLAALVATTVKPAGSFAFGPLRQPSASPVPPGEAAPSLAQLQARAAEVRIAEPQQAVAAAARLPQQVAGGEAAAVVVPAQVAAPTPAVAGVAPASDEGLGSLVAAYGAEDEE